MHVLNAVFQEILLDQYQSRYNSIPLRAESMQY